MIRPALQNKRVGVLRMLFRARNVFGTFEKRAPGTRLVLANGTCFWLHFENEANLALER